MQRFLSTFVVTLGVAMLGTAPVKAAPATATTAGTTQLADTRPANSQPASTQPASAEATRAQPARAQPVNAQPVNAQVIVFLRHGEKPDAGLGQLSCKGLNRALSLPPVLSTLFGRPDALFAPDPSKLKEDGGKDYAYIRPLATIEPTAIAAGLPVDTSFGYDEIGKLQKRLEGASAGHTIFVAWEHKEIVKLVRAMLKASGGDPDQVPKWKGKDFDSLYVLTRGADGRLTFDHRQEGLDGQSETCPGPNAQHG